MLKQLTKRLIERALEAEMAEFPVVTLPTPGYAFKVIVFSKLPFPQGFKDARFLPLQQPGIDCAGTAKTLDRQCFPLAARWNHPV